MKNQDNDKLRLARESEQGELRFLKHIGGQLNQLDRKLTALIKKVKKQWNLP